MFRGFRWQLAALAMAVGLFGFSLYSRTSETPPAPTATATPGETLTAPLPTDAPTPIPVALVQAPTSSGDMVVTYREALVGSVQRLNPVFASLNPVDRDITSLIFEGLTRANEYGEPVPALAASWVISSDGLEYIVRLRQDVFWQDGIPFSADDVVYTMAILRSPDFPGLAEVGQFWRTVETEKLAPDLVRFRLTQPLGSFLDALRIGILPEHALRGTGAAQLASHPFNLSPIGTGPYQLEALRGAEGQIRAVDLRVAPVYRQRPEGQSGYIVDRLTFHLYPDFDSAREALNRGEADGLAAGDRHQRGPLLEVYGSADGRLNLYTAVQAKLGILIFNWAKEDSNFFREQRVRLALEIGIDRSSLVERSLPNRAVRADSPIMPGSWAHIPDLVWPPYNANSARELLTTANIRVETGEAAATAEATSDSTVEVAPPTSTAAAYLYSFSILTPDDPALVNMASEIAAQWSQYSLSVTVESVEPETFRQRLEAGDFDTALVELSLGESADPDVYEFWHQGQYPDGRNFGGVSDNRISEVLERARRDSSGINRMEYYRRFQQEFVERAIAIPLYYPLFTYVIATEVEGVQIGGIISSPADRFRNIQNWSILAG